MHRVLAIGRVRPWRDQYQEGNRNVWEARRWRGSKSWKRKWQLKFEQRIVRLPLSPYHHTTTCMEQGYTKGDDDHPWTRLRKPSLSIISNPKSNGLVPESCCRNDSKRTFEEGLISKRHAEATSNLNEFLNLHEREFGHVQKRGHDLEKRRRRQLSEVDYYMMKREAEAAAALGETILLLFSSRSILSFFWCSGRGVMKYCFVSAALAAIHRSLYLVYPGMICLVCCSFQRNMRK